MKLKTWNLYKSIKMLMKYLQILRPYKSFAKIKNTWGLKSESRILEKRKVLGICIGFMSITLFFSHRLMCNRDFFFQFPFFFFFHADSFATLTSLFRYGNWYSTRRNRFNKNSDTVQFKLCSLSDGNRKVYKEKRKNHRNTNPWKKKKAIFTFE